MHEITESKKKTQRNRITIIGTGIEQASHAHLLKMERKYTRNCCRARLQSIVIDIYVHFEECTKLYAKYS